MAKIELTERGSGHPVVLIHGFPFNSHLWDNFSTRLEKSFRVILVDLPGFGRSEAFSEPHTVDHAASEVIQALKGLGITECSAVGHSLGGYVVLAMAEIEPLLFSKLVLFHSTALADPKEKKENRDKVIEFVNRNGAEAFTSGFINPLFADQKHVEIEQVRKIAIQAKKDTVIAYTKAMRDRPDRTAVLTQFPKPILIIVGEKDPGISVESVENQASLSSDVKVHPMKNTGHMGMFENPEESAHTIIQFLK